MRDEQISAFIAAAHACVGARFRLQGRDPAYGLDCIGLVIWSARQCGIILPDSADYMLSDDPARLDAVLEQAPFRSIEAASRRPGTILRLLSQGQPLHMGIDTGSSLIHADMRCRKVVEHALTPDWRARIVAAYRIES